MIPTEPSCLKPPQKLLQSYQFPFHPQATNTIKYLKTLLWNMLVFCAHYLVRVTSKPIWVFFQSSSHQIFQVNRIIIWSLILCQYLSTSTKYSQKLYQKMHFEVPAIKQRYSRQFYGVKLTPDRNCQENFSVSSGHNNRNAPHRSLQTHSTWSPHKRR